MNDEAVVYPDGSGIVDCAEMDEQTLSLGQCRSFELAPIPTHTNVTSIADPARRESPHRNPRSRATGGIRMGDINAHQFVRQSFRKATALNRNMFQPQPQAPTASM